MYEIIIVLIYLSWKTDNFLIIYLFMNLFLALELISELPKIQHV